MRLVDAITSLGGLLVPITAILVGGAIAIAAMIIRHQERIAKIERGMDPDAPPRGWSMNWNILIDGWIAVLLLLGAVWPVVTRQPLRILVPFRGMYTTGLKLQIFMQVLYMSIASCFLWPVFLKVAGK
jgi:hypothetical protein